MIMQLLHLANCSGFKIRGAGDTGINIYHFYEHRTICVVTSANCDSSFTDNICVIT